MKAWIGPALVSEGPTDDRFFSGIIVRTLREVLAREFDAIVEVGDVIAVRPRSGPSPVHDCVAELERNAGSYNLVVYHHDAGSNRDKVMEEWVTPMRNAWAAAGLGDPLVCVVPARETEAWTLADGDAIREVFGVNWSDSELGIPGKPSRVAQIADPKQAINDIADRASGRRVDYLARLGELVSLQQLAHVQAYAEWQHELTRALDVDLTIKRIARKSGGRG